MNGAKQPISDFCVHRACSSLNKIWTVKTQTKRSKSSIDYTHQTAGNLHPWKEIVLAIQHSSKPSRKENKSNA